MKLFIEDEQAEELFPCLGDEGQDVYPSQAAIALAHEKLGAEKEELMRWHLPDIFSVRYGSSYIGSVRCGTQELQFHSTDGTFKEGIDNRW